MKVKLKFPGGLHGEAKWNEKEKTLEIEPFFYPGQGQQLVLLTEVVGDGGASNKKIINVTANSGDLKCVKAKVAEDRVKPAFDKKSDKPADKKDKTNESAATGSNAPNPPLSPEALAGKK